MLVIKTQPNSFTDKCTYHKLIHLLLQPPTFLTSHTFSFTNSHYTSISPAHIHCKMSTNACDSLRNINSSRADWKVKARVIRQWRGSTNSGIVFKSYNILLLDAKVSLRHVYQLQYEFCANYLISCSTKFIHKQPLLQNCRMHVFIPAAIADKMSSIIEEGKIYLIKNFTVKDFTEKDNYRVVHMDKQISFTTETRVKELDDSEIFIPTNNFDLFQFSDLKSQATQDVYLTGKYICTKTLASHYRSG